MASILDIRGCLFPFPLENPSTIDDIRRIPTKLPGETFKLCPRNEFFEHCCFDFLTVGPDFFSGQDIIIPLDYCPPGARVLISVPNQWKLLALRYDSLYLY